MTTSCERRGPSRILVVEHDHDVREAFVDVLSDEGHHLAAAPDGTSGLAIAATFCPALVLLDPLLPDISAAEFVARIRAEPATAQAAVVMTATDELRERRTPPDRPSLPRSGTPPTGAVPGSDAGARRWRPARAPSSR